MNIKVIFDGMDEGEKRTMLELIVLEELYPDAIITDPRFITIRQFIERNPSMSYKIMVALNSCECVFMKDVSMNHLRKTYGFGIAKEYELQARLKSMHLTIMP